MERITRLIPELKIGNGLNEDTDVGPVISDGQLKRVMKFIEEGKKVSNLLLGGNRLTDNEYSNGHFIEPTVFEDVPPQSIIAQEEIFGPVISIIRVSDLDEIAEIANDTKYGLSAAIWTSNISKALRLARMIKAGVVWINTYGKLFAETETGLYKQSGIGGALRGIEALHTFSELKNIMVNVG
jgi:betaine-aldehyde dehydrogenase